MASDSQPPVETATDHCTDVAAFLRILHEPDAAFEVRILNCPERAGGSFASTAAGWFVDTGKAAKDVQRIEKLKPPAIYLTINPCKSVLMGRAMSRIKPKAKSTTADGDILRRRWLFIDIDAKRPAGVSSTDTELGEADAVSDVIVAAMRAAGWPDPLIGMSGNGRYLLWRIDMPNDDESTALIKSVLQTLAQRFDTGGAEVDCSTFNAGRICKLLGTVARKGDELVGLAGIDDRPHRRSWFIPPASPLDVVSTEQLKRLAEQYVEPEQTKVHAAHDALANGQCDVSERASRYLAKCDPAIAGQHGHNRLLTAAIALVQGFDLPADEAMRLLTAEYNPRCEPAWSAKEMRHKVDEAMRLPGERGRLLYANGDRLLSVPAGGKQETIAAPGSTIVPICRPNLVCMADVEPRAVRWLWDQRIPAGRLSLVVGMPGCGKSFVTCDMASRVSNGTPWPDGSPCEQGSVLFITAEDDPADTIRPRLDSHGADVSRVHLLAGAIERDKDGRERDVCFTLADVLILETTLSQLSDCKLIVIDPIGSFLGGRTDSHRDNEVRSVLAPVSRLAELSGAAVVVVAHRRKGSSGSADDTALGSRAFTGLARAVWHLSRDADDPRRRLWLPGKNNLAAEPDGLAFSITGMPASVQWERDPVAMTADDAMARERDGERGDKSATDEAADWLRDTLDGGPRLASELKGLAKHDGIAVRTLERAANDLGVLKGPAEFGGPWSWRMPDSDSLANEAQSRQGLELGETDETWRDCGPSAVDPRVRGVI